MAPAVSTRQPRAESVAWLRAASSIRKALSTHCPSPSLTPPAASSSIGSSRAVSIAVSPISTEKKSMQEP
eukprot:CAMPEP_0115851172 /NCGR_PEP_ID=MMETSP0287-20121206/12344_1 /TAXON_ID=412157 /ORGANISM="Chrysochromulina rotalis, Strain UIO044" /LENGTH=69 /DNA_ID=CAMNT_0003305195 /DNA_START=281 /DNA_END=490 /DNA_ORIENTATION=-